MSPEKTVGVLVGVVVIAGVGVWYFNRGKEKSFREAQTAMADPSSTMSVQGMGNDPNVTANLQTALLDPSMRYRPQATVEEIREGERYSI